MKNILNKAINKLKNKISMSTYESKIANEIDFYSDCENVHDLPDIFHYWSNKYLLPMQQKFGFSNPDDFFITYTYKFYVKNMVKNLSIASIGSGNGELEVSVAENLKSNGVKNFVIECVDINKHMLERTLKLAKEKGVGEHIKISKSDFN